MRTRAEELQTALIAAQNETSDLTRRLVDAESRANDAEASARTQASSLAGVQSQLSALERALESERASHSASTQSLAETRLRLEESDAVATRYKAQVLELRESSRAASESLERGARAEREASRLAGENAALQSENQQLKSQLFDSFQVEKTLKAALEAQQAQSAGGASGGAAANPAAALRIASLEAEVASLRATLLAKETEHKELMTICNDLISQVEMLKGAPPTQ